MSHRGAGCFVRAACLVADRIPKRELGLSAKFRIVSLELNIWLFLATDVSRIRAFRAGRRTIVRAFFFCGRVFVTMIAHNRLNRCPRCTEGNPLHVSYSRWRTYTIRKR